MICGFTACYSETQTCLYSPFLGSVSQLSREPIYLERMCIFTPPQLVAAFDVIIVRLHVRLRSTKTLDYVMAFLKVTVNLHKSIINRQRLKILCPGGYPPTQGGREKQDLAEGRCITQSQGKGVTMIGPCIYAVSKLLCIIPWLICQSRPTLFNSFAMAEK